MKKMILTGLAGLAMLSVAFGRTDPSYVNDLVNIYNSSPPPSIDATIFINNSGFIVGASGFGFGMPYGTANTLYYTNYGALGGMEGFRFDTFNTHGVTSFYTPADTLFNKPGAVINCGGTNWGPYAVGGQNFGALCLISATNIINRGTIEVGPNGLLSLQGQNVNLFGGLLNMEGFESGDQSGQAGMIDGYWGIGPTPEYNPVASFRPTRAVSPLYWVTNRDYTISPAVMSLSTPTTYTNSITNAISKVTTEGEEGGSTVEWGIDRSALIVYLQNGDVANIQHYVYFPGESMVEWAWPSTNIVTGLSQTNHLYLFDNIVGSTNLIVLTNGFGPASTAHGPTFIPTNYSIFRSGATSLTPATNRLATGMIAPSTNWVTTYTAYEALFDPTTVLLSDVAGQTYTNMPGRIEVTANNQLDLSSSRIASLNYLRVTATNNFKKDANTRILTYAADYNLAATNGMLSISNLLSPTSPRLTGFVDVFSTCWTNFPDPSTNVVGKTTNVYYYTNSYFITMVNTHLSSSSPALVPHLNLRATNVVLGDIFNVLSNIIIDADNLTITTNAPGAQTLSGQLNLASSIAIGASTFPHLKNLTNFGTINADNAVTFGAANVLSNFVNRGTILADGCTIRAANFENSGLINAGFGAINLSATSAVLSNGVLNAAYNDMVLNAGSLFSTNHVLNAGRSLTIRATNSLSDGGPASSNRWNVGTLGFSLPTKPPVANLLGTAITNTIPAYDYYVECQWAGQDLGPVASGYSNNAALGRLILSGGAPSSFYFTSPSGTSNALYVDYLEFRNYMTNFDGSGSLAGLSFGPGMKIYYAQLIINGVSWAESLNGKNDGGLNWVPAYAGAFSSSNVVYSDGTTNRLNTALVTSCTIDSNGNGVPNCTDTNPIPVLTPASLALTVTFTNAPQRAVELSWNSIAYSTNYVYFKASSAATNWQLLTTNSSLPVNPFVLGPAGGRQRVLDPLKAGGLYRVRVDAGAP